MDLNPVAYDATPSYLYIISYFECTYYTIFVNINMVTNAHFHVLVSTLLFHVSRA